MIRLPIQRLLRTAALLLLSAFLCCIQPNALAETEERPLRIAVASDLHMQTVSGNFFANPLVPYHAEIIDALLWDAVESDVDMLLLLGDITNQGKRSQHEMLLEKLRDAESRGITIVVLPGNHDIGEVKTQDFPELYRDFGYGDAYSRDPFSMSYTLQLGDRLLMLLDTNGYPENRHEALLRPETLLWIETQLRQAQANNWQILVAGHYPIMTAQSTPFAGREEAAALFLRYQIPMYLCGHMHGRLVARQERVTELIVDQAISYPCFYAMLELSADGGIRYEPKKIDITGYAETVNSPYKYLHDFDAFQAEVAKENWRNTNRILMGDRTFDPDALVLADDFFCQTLDARAYGVLYRHTKELKAHPGYPVFMELAGTTVYSRWIPSILEDISPFTAGFSLDAEGGITAAFPLE